MPAHNRESININSLLCPAYRFSQKEKTRVTPGRSSHSTLIVIIISTQPSLASSRQALSIHRPRQGSAPLIQGASPPWVPPFLAFWAEGSSLLGSNPSKPLPFHCLTYISDNL